MSKNKRLRDRRDRLFKRHPYCHWGCCGLAPVVTINEDLYGSVTQAKLPKIIGRYQDESVPVGAEAGVPSDE